MLVKRDNHYALRYPVTGIDLTDALEDLAVEMQFGDSYAIEDEDSLTSTERNILLDAGWIAPLEESKKKTAPGVLGAPQTKTTGPQWIYTRGIDLATIRKMLGPHAGPVSRHRPQAGSYRSRLRQRPGNTAGRRCHREVSYGCPPRNRPAKHPATA